MPNKITSHVSIVIHITVAVTVDKNTGLNTKKNVFMLVQSQQPNQYSDAFSKIKIF